MAHLAISLLGSFQVVLDGQPITGLKSNKVRALLAYLAVEHDRPHSRDSLAGLLWPEWSDQEALNNLRYTLSNLRSVIGDHTANPPYLLITRESLQFNQASDCWLDMAVFVEKIEGNLAGPTDLQALEQVVSLYRGNFLEGFFVSDSPAFEEWTLLVRERVARQMRSALQSLAGAYEQRGEYERAQVYAWRRLEFEPWDESAHQQVMRLLVYNGQRSAALAQYETCRKLLAKELGVEPGQETKKLYEQIRADTIKPVSQPPIPAPQREAALPKFLIEEPPPVERSIFVARNQELEALIKFLEVAITGQSRIVFVTGEAGSGKTTLLQEFARRAQAAHPNLCVASGNCNAHTGIGDPYLPFREILDLLTGGVQARLAAGAIDREQARLMWNLLPTTVKALVEAGPDLIDTFIARQLLAQRAGLWDSGEAGLQHLLGEYPQRKSTKGLDASGLLQVDLFEQYTQILRILAQDRPLLLMLDDLQWSDMGSTSLLFHLGKHLAGSPILVVGAFRAEDITLSDQAGERHSLEPVINEFQRMYGDIIVNIELADGQDFIEALLDSEPNRLKGDFKNRLYQQTHGHPLFTIELLRGLQDRQDIIKESDGCWVEREKVNWEILPARVEAAIRERINRLPEKLHQALVVASVEGEEFTAEIAAQILGIDERTMVQWLSGELARKYRLVKAQSIERIGPQRVSRYRFRNFLFQKYVYENLDQAERAYLHEDIGNHLEKIYGERANEIAVQLARHFQEAINVDKAISYLFQAGKKAVELCAYQEAMAHLETALALLLEQPETPERAERELGLQISYGMAIMGHSPGEAWLKALNRARVLCLQTGKTSELSWIYSKLAIYHYLRAEYTTAVEVVEEALRLAGKSQNLLILSLSHWCLGFISFTLGEFTTTRYHLKEMISFYEPHQRQPLILLQGSDPGLSALAYDACALWCLGFPDQAAQLSQEALTGARELAHAFTSADILCYAGCLLAAMRRDGEALKAYAEELFNLVNNMRLLGWLSNANIYRAAAQILLGQYQVGIEQLTEGIASVMEINVLLNLTTALGFLAEAQDRTGQLEQAHKAIDDALTLVEKTQERYGEAELYRIKAQILVAHGDKKRAESTLQKAIEVARQQEAKSWELRAVIDLARLWQSNGEKEKARKMLYEIYAWFHEGLDTNDLVAAQQLLAELTE